MNSSLEERIARRVDDLPEGLRQHTYRVQAIAQELARGHGLDEEKVRLGSLAHDIARAMKGKQLLQKAHELGITVHSVEARLPVLLHGPVGAELLRRVDGLEDRDIYEAVYWHSVAHSELPPAAKVVFLADKLDPQKVSRYPFLPQLRDVAASNLDRAILDFLNRELISQLQQGSLVHPVSLDARNELIAKIVG